MIYCFMGGTCSGKNTLMTEFLLRDFNCHAVVRDTTRTRRVGEVDGVDYHFVSVDDFRGKSLDAYVEWERFSGDRYYGTRKEVLDATEGDPCLTLTPQGLIDLVYYASDKDICVIYLQVSLGEAIKRYVDRVGVNQFAVEDKMEMCDRLARDEGMFKGFDLLCKSLGQTHKGKFFFIPISASHDPDYLFDYVKKFLEDNNEGF